ncbi:MAG: hypothetical protein DWQ07_19880 [Chloroflexi bacterium]|nr:MAG: hypothetical protein DWQ07_19880 [Chloroflexota bacterium]MBL1194344.1 hypothetical protein [Chloroflexota bacterium]NOH11634.1 hypothetical protein [Chloroflexota bacterium]
MADTLIFHPPRRLGYIFHIAASAIILLAVALLFDQATRAELGLLFLLYLLAALFLAVLLPVLLYRLWAMHNAAYILQRDGVRLQWGMRVEDIPMNEVEYVRPVEDLVTPLDLPRVRWPGTVLGEVQHPDMAAAEYMASQPGGLVLVGTQRRTFIVSPADRDTFVRTFNHQIELGSLTPVAGRSVYPSFLLAEVWASLPARILLIVGSVLSLALLVWVALAVPNRETVSLGFSASGAPRDPVASAQLFLLPVVNLFFFSANFVLSMFFYRRSQQHPVPYILWGSSALTAAMFLGAVLLIL